ncbi:MAG: hypothetical protein PHE17_11740 [Thiothrix sp.]|uniref:hypothetical protein n=1 Tax=Thiothrix sp. TaxID=1032 RepID=UPI0026299410|nr:hypothetical protein [Thiothrix sp.]MDD5393680.1 hypothetical protein [Thiothrix sp.]
MKLLQGALTLAVLLGAQAAYAEEPNQPPAAAEGLGLMPGVKTRAEIAPPAPITAAQQGQAQAAQNGAFPPQNVTPANQLQYPGVGQTAAQFPNQAYMQQPYANAYRPYGNYAYPSGAYPAYPYAAQGYNPYMMQQRQMPYGGMRPPIPQQPKKKEVKPWGDTRYIWPDFYTDFTGDVWDKMMNTPYDMGYMPGGWRFPSLSSPDPVTVSDAITNQFPPVFDEAGNFVNFAK